MTALTDFAMYKARHNSPRQVIETTHGAAGTSITTGIWASLWTIVATSGAAPTTPVACDSSLTGAESFVNSSAEQFLGRCTMSSNYRGTWMLCDRLSHQAGLSGTATGAQTTNLPTAALTRYTSGVGVLAAIEIYTAIGATATTLTASYTNQAGTAGRTTDAIAWGSSFAARRVCVLPLQGGDTGVRSVESVTNAATTGTVGNFGVTLFRPLAVYPVELAGKVYTFDPLMAFGGMMPKIFDNACLFWIHCGCQTAVGPGMISIDTLEP